VRLGGSEVVGLDARPEAEANRRTSAYGSSMGRTSTRPSTKS
jgi:hypothetical protein